MKKKTAAIIILLVICLGLPVFAQSKPIQTDLERPFDKNKNNILDPDETKLLVETLRAALFAPHPVKTSIDEMIDKNRNNKITEEEIKLIWVFLIEGEFQKPRKTENLLDQALDKNKDKSVKEQEI